MPATFETKPRPAANPTTLEPAASEFPSERPHLSPPDPPDCLDVLITTDTDAVSPRTRSLPRPALVDDQSRIIWPYIIGVILFHLTIPLAFLPYFFSWWGVAWLPVGNYIFCSMGIGAGFHRLLTHRGYKCPLWLEHTLALLGVCNLQESPARWVVVHRLHHQHSDHQPDPRDDAVAPPRCREPATLFHTPGFHEQLPVRATATVSVNAGDHLPTPCGRSVNQDGHPFRLAGPDLPKLHSLDLKYARRSPLVRRDRVIRREGCATLAEGCRIVKILERGVAQNHRNDARFDVARTLGFPQNARSGKDARSASVPFRVSIQCPTPFEPATRSPR